MKETHSTSEAGAEETAARLTKLIQNHVRTASTAAQASLERSYRLAWCVCCALMLFSALLVVVGGVWQGWGPEMWERVVASLLLGFLPGMAVGGYLTIKRLRRRMRAEMRGKMEAEAARMSERAWRELYGPEANRIDPPAKKVINPFPGGRW